MRLAIAILLATALPASAGAVDVRVDWSSAHQTVVGFGGSMGWIHPHPQQRERVFDLLFRDLGVSVLRVRALGDERGQELSLEPKNDNADPGTFNWDAFPIRTTEAKNAVILRAAKKRGVRTLIATAWSPPAWMKDSARRAGGGRLLPAAIDEYAELWAAYALGMRRAFDIQIDAVSIQNEPDMEYYYCTCGMPPTLYAQAKAAVAKRFRAEGLTTRLLGPDTCRIYNMPDYVRAMPAAPGEPILTHLYDLSIPFERVDKDPERWQEARTLARSMRRPLWLMETGNYLSDGAAPGSYDEALLWAQKIHHALVHGDCQVVCYWSLYFDKKAEALIYAPKSESPTFEITPKYYTSMHTYRFVRPGMVRCEAAAGDPRLLVSAFRGDAKRVIVLINPSKNTLTVSVPFATALCYETTPVKRCALTPWRGPQLTMPPRAITTLIARP